jgi:hypothetical protein
VRYLSFFFRSFCETDSFLLFSLADLLFQSLWGGSGVLGGIGESGGGVNPALNLFGTLGLTGGDEFGLE